MLSLLKKVTGLLVELNQFFTLRYDPIGNSSRCICPDNICPKDICPLLMTQHVPNFFDPIVWVPKKIWLKFCKRQIFFWPKIILIKILLDTNYFDPNFFFTQKTFDPKFVWTKILDKKISMTQNFLGPAIFVNQNYLHPKIYFTQFFLDQIFFYT